MSNPNSALIDRPKVEQALKIYTVMAFIVGIGLLMLVLEMVLHYGFKNDALSWWPQPHGLLYLLYIGATANLGFKARWSLGRMVLIILAGCVPFLSFWVERKVNAQTRAEVAAL